MLGNGAATAEPKKWSGRKKFARNREMKCVTGQKHKFKGERLAAPL
jgi:hypothetical protein